MISELREERLPPSVDRGVGEIVFSCDGSEEQIDISGDRGQ